MSVPIITTVAGLQSFLQTIGQASSTAEPKNVLANLGLVPTMGALHRGHLSLIERARYENRWVIVSLFVNPLQFAPTEDLDRYPQRLEQDQQLCEQAGVDAIFAPSPSELLKEDAMTAVVPPIALTQGLCGASRPGHFQGVATIVLKLLNLIGPDRAYFGRKDAQQLAIIERLVTDLNVPVEIVPCPIVREASGLALSSRNQYLDQAQQQTATVLSASLQTAQQCFQEGIRDRNALLTQIRHTLAQEPDVKLEYAELVDPMTLQPLTEIESVGMVAIAAHLNKTRLIDNLLLDARQPILAIDGPAGAGKSTVTRLCAQALGLKYLDTGAMYRAMTWLVLQSQIELDHSLAIADLVSQSDIQLQLDANPDRPPSVWVQGKDVTEAIRTPEVTQSVSAIAAQSAVRQALVQQQRTLGQAGGIAAEGRDIGTHVFPDAGLKIFLTASIAERARRRQQDLAQRGAAPIDFEALQQQIALRDRKDSQRAISPLCKAYDAVEVNTDGLSITEVTEQIVALYRNCLTP
ncbi:MAG: bifunctional pantoate--beta-alanine ligase/(d)CMP kinase [Thermosynechococcaceae cyanobacterium]